MCALRLLNSRFEFRGRYVDCSVPAISPRPLSVRWRHENNATFLLPYRRHGLRQFRCCVFFTNYGNIYYQRMKFPHERTNTRVQARDMHTQHGTIGLHREYAIAIQDEVGDSNGAMCSTSQCELRSTFPNLRVTNVIRIVTFYTLPPLESPTSSWM